jgi:PmbA protein
MLGESIIREILEKALRASPADETEIVLEAHDSALTRFSNNVIHQNVAEVNTEIAVRVVLGKRVGAAITNRLTEEALGQAIEEAVALARLQPENPEFPGLPEPQPVEPVAAFDEAVAGATPEWRARAVGAVCRLAESMGVSAAGALSTGVYELAVVNSKGVFAYHAGTETHFSTVVMSDNGSGYAHRAAWRLADLNVEALGHSAIERALQSRNPRPIEPGVYPVVLEPYAVEDILSWLGYAGAGALAVQEGRSWMNDRIGRPVMSPQITIWDDGRDPAGLPMPFDFEGVPRQRVVIVERGVPQGPVYDTVTAAWEGQRSTGHALPRSRPQTASLGPIPLHLFMAPGEATIEEMVRQVDRGLYVTRFWYTRLVHPRDCVLTGMTRDGVFWIEKGEIAYPVRNLRFTQGYVPALAGVRAVGKERWLISEGFGFTSVPALLLEAFAFTGVTEF